ncbi:DUF3046 domain-containing protein [Pseudolysinimonas sp.]|uniref:DUF3046 domain-containing protein n=1 Tax=Pseudolysinimonas sp. TaxID=2680009 RepID=UPI00286BB21A|nr:DUF3046 domain-containing protein [Pseudolysinimonas sp.]
MKLKLLKLSEFTRAVDDEFGAFGRVLLRDTVMVELGNRTPEQALAAGIPARDVWIAMCRVQEVPVDRWHGAGLPKPARG